MSSCLLSILTNPARWSHQQVTEVHSSQRSSEPIVKFVSTLSKHTRQEREAGSGQEDVHTWHWPLCYHCWLMCSYIKVLFGYSMSATKGQLILWGRFWGMPALRTPWSHSRFTIPKDKPKLHLRGTPASLKTNTLRQTKSKLREGRSKAKHARCKTDGNEPQCAALWNMSYLTIQTAALH